MKPYQYYTLMFVLLLMAGDIFYGTYQRVKPYDIETVFDQNHMPVINKPLKAGDIIRWTAHYIIHIADVPDEYTYYLEAAGGQKACSFRILFQGTGATVAGESNHLSELTRVPEGIYPCLYHVRIQTSFHPAPGRTIIINAQTEDFPII